MKIENAKELDEAIERMEKKKLIQEGMLSDQFHATVDHFKPKNLIKSAFRKVAEPGTAQNTILKAAGGIGVGLLAKKLLIGKSTSFVGKLAANALKVGATNTVLHNSGTISAWGQAIYKNLFAGKNKDSKQI